MSYSEPLSSQLGYFFYSLGFGVIVELWYVLVIFIRMCIGDSKRAVIIADLIFCAVAGLASFFFMVLYNNGQVRLNLISGQIAGACVTHIIIGGRILKYSEKFTLAVRGLIHLLFIPFFSLKGAVVLAADKIRSLPKHKFIKSDKNKIKKLKNFNIIAKIHLKNKNKSV